ncbi:hypothetical protein EON62_05040, partial [archaeon]
MQTPGPHGNTVSGGTAADEAAGIRSSEEHPTSSSIAMHLEHDLPPSAVSGLVHAGTHTYVTDMSVPFRSTASHRSHASAGAAAHAAAALSATSPAGGVTGPRTVHVESGSGSAVHTVRTSASVPAKLHDTRDRPVHLRETRSAAHLLRTGDMDLAHFSSVPAYVQPSRTWRSCFRSAPTPAPMFPALDERPSTGV